MSQKDRAALWPFSKPTDSVVFAKGIRPKATAQVQLPSNRELTDAQVVGLILLGLGLYLINS